MFTQAYEALLHVHVRDFKGNAIVTLTVTLYTIKMAILDTVATRGY